MFIEEWLIARGYNGVETDQMVTWRREHMSNLVNALDLDHVSSAFAHDFETRAIDTIL